MRWTVVGALALGWAAIAWAEDEKAPQPQAPNAERFFKAFDANGDGKIDREEFEKGLPQMTSRWREARRPEAADPEKRPERRSEDRPDGRAERRMEGRPAGAPAEMPDRLERLVEEKVNQALERKAPEIARRIHELVAKDVREIIERRAPEVGRRIREHVAREGCDGPGPKMGEGRKGSKLAPPLLDKEGCAPECPRAIAPSRERHGWADVPEFGPPMGRGGRDGRPGEMRRSLRHGDGCECPACRRGPERMGRGWGAPARDGCWAGRCKSPCHGDGCLCPECEPSRERMGRAWGGMGRGWGDGPGWRGPRGRCGEWRD